jgi:hypothetical protein
MTPVVGDGSLNPAVSRKHPSGSGEMGDFFAEFVSKKNWHKFCNELNR